MEKVGLWPHNNNNNNNDFALKSTRSIILLYAQCVFVVFGVTLQKVHLVLFPTDRGDAPRRAATNTPHLLAHPLNHWAIRGEEGHVVVSCCWCCCLWLINFQFSAGIPIGELWTLRGRNFLFRIHKLTHTDDRIKCDTGISTTPKSGSQSVSWLVG